MSSVLRAYGRQGDLPVGSFCDTRVKPLAQKYSVFPKTQITLYSQPSRPVPKEGRCATSRNVGRDAVDAEALLDERR